MTDRNFETVGDFQEYLDSHPNEAAIFSAWLMVRGAFTTLTQEYTEEEAANLLQKLVSFAPKDVKLNADVYMKITEKKAA